MANKRFIDFPIATTVGDNDIILIWQSGANKQTTKATILSGVPDSLNDLTDVTISGLTNGQILRYDSVSGQWENTDQGNLDLNDLNDVTIVSPTNGQVLVYNSSTSKWENSSGGYVPYVGAVTTVNLGAQTIQAGSFVKQGGTSSQFLKANGSVDSTAYGTGSVTSVGLTMPAAFNVANSPITTAGTLAVTGAGTVAQYIRGDGSLADFPESSGGGSSVSYYLNGSVAQGTIGGIAYNELSKVPILGAGTDFTINADGYIASFITDAGDPNLLEIPGGNWNFETYFSASSGGGSPTFYVELYKVNAGGTANLIASSSTSPELIAFGTNLTPYFSSLAVPTTTLALTDRLAVRYYVTHAGRTITLHTENNHLCQIITTFTTGLTALNGLTAQVQNFAVGTTGTDFNIASATATHTFNLPTASATNRGALSSTDWSMFNAKQNALTNPITGTGASGQVAYFTGTTAISSESNLFWDATNDRLGIGVNPSYKLDVVGDIHSASELYLDNGYYLRFKRSSGGLSIQTLGIPSGTDDVRLLTTGDFNLVNGSLTNLMTVKNGGNIGIGINTITNSKLLVAGTHVTGHGILGIVPVGNNTATIALFNSSVLRKATLFSDTGFVRLETDADPLLLSSAGNLGINIFTNGRVFVGSSPSDSGFQFDVNGTGRFTSDLTVNNLIIANNDARIRNNDATGRIIISNSITNTFAIFYGSSHPTNANQTVFANGGVTTCTFTSLGNANFEGNVTANSLIKIGGTSSQFLKADGSVDSTTYVPVGRTITINGTTQDLSANRTFNVGTVTSVTASSPLASSGGTTPNITIQQASGSQSGFLSSTDWTTFNGKQNALTLTTTGSSGAATLVGSTLNIPNYGSALSGYLPLIGGTLTGPLNGTSASFTGAFEAGRTGGAVTSGDLLVDSTSLSANVYVGRLSSTSNDNTNFIVRNRIGSELFKVTGNTGAATFTSSVNANGVMSLGNDGTFGSTYKTLGFTGNTTGTHRIFAGTADDMYFAAATGRGFEFRANGGGVGNLNIISNGNVGIGTPSPGNRLVVQGSNSTPQFRIIRQENTNQGFTIRAGGGETFFNSYDGSNIVYGSYAFEATKGSDTQTRMLINNDGNVLIGTVTDNGLNARLQVRNLATITGPSTAGLSVRNESGVFVGLGVGVSSGYVGTTSNHPFNFQANSIVLATLKTDGEFQTNAISTSSPVGGTAAIWKLGKAATVSPTSPNRTIEVEVAGTTYYLHAKTTNN
jgi:hypothetical protein